MTNKNNEKLIETVKTHPELPIIPATYYEVVAEDWGYWCGEISDVRVDYFYLKNDRWYAGEEDIKNQLFCHYEDSECCHDMSNKEFNIFIDSKFENMKNEGVITKAIILFINH